MLDERAIDRVLTAAKITCHSGILCIVVGFASDTAAVLEELSARVGFPMAWRDESSVLMLRYKPRVLFDDAVIVGTLPALFKAQVPSVRDALLGYGYGTRHLTLVFYIGRADGSLPPEIDEVEPVEKTVHEWCPTCTGRVRCLLKGWTPFPTGQYVVRVPSPCPEGRWWVRVRPWCVRGGTLDGTLSPPNGEVKVKR